LISGVVACLYGDTPLGYRAWHIEMKDRFGAGPHICQAPPARIPGPGSTVATKAIPHIIDRGMVIIGGPVLLKVVKEGRPIGQQVIGFEIPQRKRKGVVYPDYCQPVFGKQLNHPLSDPTPCPILARAWRRQ